MSLDNLGPGSDVCVDVVIVGAGVAGLVAALDLLDVDPGLSIAVVDKGAMGSTGSTPLAQGGMAVAMGPDDTPALHAQDTIIAGDGLCDARAVAVMAQEGPARTRDLMRRGVSFDRNPDGSLHLAREGGQRVARSVHTADATGAEIFRALRAAATGRVIRIQGVACAIAVCDPPADDIGGGYEPSPAVGVWVLLDDVEESEVGPASRPGLALLRGRRTLLATGGCGGLFAATTNRDGATADGVALAYGAGAALLDIEFVQFHPTGLRTGGGSGFWRLLLTEALRGAGAKLIDAEGRRFMPDWHPDAELAPRYIVTKAILAQTGGAWLDATHLSADEMAHEFPTVAAGAAAHGFDLSAQPVPVEPAEHYMIGGVATDLHGRSSVPGLYAAGEVACTGVHGANRMAGNSLMQSCVYGSRAGRAIAADLAAGAGHATGDPAPPVFAEDRPDADLTAVRATLRRTMTAGVGPIRSAESLEKAAAELVDLAGVLGEVPVQTRDSVELHHAATVGRLIARSATLRRESRGVHWRDDFESHDPGWAGVRLRISPDGTSARTD
jgi:L-aspartate oxidase